MGEQDLYEEQETLFREVYLEHLKNLRNDILEKQKNDDQCKNSETSENDEQEDFKFQTIYVQMSNNCGQDFKESSESMQKTKRIPKKKKQKILSTLDILISTFVVSPLVIAAWRGTWGLCDVYEKYFPPWESFLIGNLIHLILTLAQEHFHDIFIKKRKGWPANIAAFFFMKFYTVFFNFVTNVTWRGGWILLDQYLDTTLDPETNLTTVKKPYLTMSFYTICFLIMFFTKTLRNLGGAPPFEICMDYGNDMFLFPSMFKFKSDQSYWLYLLDTSYSVIIVTNLGVFLWRGFWLIFEIAPFPEDFVLNTWAVTFLSFVWIFITFMTQKTVKSICDQFDGIRRLLIADAYMIFACLGGIANWVGIWNLLDIYFLPENFELSCWISKWASLILLMMMGCSNSVLVRGVYIDAEEPGGECVVFTCSYLRNIYVKEKAKKIISWKDNIRIRTLSIGKEYRECKISMEENNNNKVSNKNMMMRLDCEAINNLESLIKNKH